MRGACKYVVAAALSLLPSLAFAQATLTGTVRDASGGVLPGVTVEASSPALTEKTRTVVTDGNGVYRIIELNPGTYSLTFSLQGFGTVKRDGVELAGTQVITIPVEMRVGELQETITVTGETPVVDVQSVKREVVLDNEVVQAIPATRAVGSLLNATPGLTVDNNGVQPTPTMTFFSARGGQTNEGRMTVNGMTVAAAFNGGGVSSYILDSVNVDEVSVVVSGGMGESDIGAPVMNLVPRSGGNSFRGQAFINNAGDWSRGDNLDAELEAVGIRETPGIISSYDGSVSYGGPIKRDRLWFFGSYRKLDTSTAVEGIRWNRNAFDATRWDWVEEPGITARQLQGREMFIGRATAQVTQKNRLSFQHEYQTRCEGSPLRVESDGCHRREAGWVASGSATTSPESTTNYFDFPYYLTQALWTNPFTSKILFEAGLTRFSYYHAGGPGQVAPDGIFNQLIAVTEQSTATNPATGLPYAPRANYVYRALPRYQDNYGNPNNWRASASYVTGTHNLKVGYQGSYLRAESTFVTPEHALAYTFNQGNPVSYTFSLPSFQQSDRTKTASVFLQDTWTRGRLTLQGALRYDRAWSFSPAEHNGTELTNRFLTAPVSFEKTVGVDAFNDLTPRVGVAYDLFGNGRTAIKFNFGHYLDAATNDSVYTANNPSAKTVGRTGTTRNWTDNNGNKVIDCDVLNFNAQTPATTGSVDTCGQLTGDNLNFGRPGQLTTVVDPEILHGWGVRQNDWQWGINVQQELMPRISIEVGYNRRWWSGPSATDGLVTDDLARTPADYEAWTITAPIDPRLPGGGGYPITVYTQTAAVSSIPARNFQTLETNFGEFSEYWHGVDITGNARLRNGLTLQVGTSTGRKVIDRCDTITKVDSPAPTIVNVLQDVTNCFSKEPFQTTVRGLASYTVPKLDVRLSGTVRSQPGLPLTATWIAPNSLVQAALGHLPPGALPTGTTMINLLNNSDRRLYADERRTQIDMRVAKIFRFRRARADVGFDLNNLLNTNYATTFENTYQNSPSGGTWNNPTAVYAPRFVRVNATFDF